MSARLLDLYDTIAWTDWPAVSRWMLGRLEVEETVLFEAYLATRDARGSGQFGSAVGDVAALAQACGRPQDGRAVERLADDLANFMRGQVYLYDDVLPALRAWRARGIPVAIVSNCDHVTRPVIDHLGLEREVDVVLLSCEVGCRKPDPSIFEEALRRLSVRAGDAVFVDDQPAYLAGAAAQGLVALHMIRPPPAGADVWPGADVLRFPVVHSLDEIELALAMIRADTGVGSGR
jgi:HAD superfamily hydrolase (TIGR01509 family)